MTWRTTRLDGVALRVKRPLDPQLLGDRLVDHYSIPSLESTGGPELVPPVEILSTKQLLKGGEVMVSRLNPRKARVIAVPNGSRTALASGEFVVMQPQGVEPRFLTYLLLSETVRQYLDSRVQSVTRSHQRVRPEVLMQMNLSIPDQHVQHAIADYLDTENSRIDTLITKKRRMIELLEELRRTLITVVVTGCDTPGSRTRSPSDSARHASPSHHPLRDPSPPRRGDRVTTLRRLARTTGGAGFPHAEQGLESGDLPFVKVSDFNHGGNERTITTCNNWVSRETARRLRATVVPTGSVLLPKVGAALLGNGRRIVSQPSVFDNNILGVVPDNISSRYLHYWLTTVDTAQFAKPGPVPSMDDSAVLNLRVPIVSRSSQRAIADRLDTETSRIDTLITKTHQTISLLTERRQALITATVTGESVAE